MSWGSDDVILARLRSPLAANPKLVISAFLGHAAIERTTGRRVQGDKTIRTSLAPKGPGPIDARTSNGSITLNLSPVMQGRLTLTTSNGSIRVDSSCKAQVVSEQKNRAVLDFGSAENQSNATTSNGSIQVKQAKDIGH